MLKRAFTLLLCLTMLPLFACSNSGQIVSLELTDQIIRLKEGESRRIEIKEFKFDDVDADKTLIKYSSDRENIATVTDGTVTARSAGDAIVTVSYSNVEEKVFVIVEKTHVSESVNSLDLSDKIAKLNVGDSYSVNVKEFMLDNKIADKALLQYSTENEKVATVTDGVVKARGLGSTVIKVSYGDIFAELAVTVDAYPAVAALSDVKEMNSDAVKIHGRYVRDENDNLVFDNVNSGLEIWFYGTECRVNFNVAETSYVANGQIQYSFLRVYLDDEIKEGYDIDVEELNVSGKLVALSTFGDNVTYTLASGLEKDFHRIQILKASEQKLNGDTKWVVTALNSDENCQILKAKKEKQLKIDFYGDSISCGAGALGVSGEHIYNTNGDGTKTYASFTARALDADCSVVSKSGLCVAAELVGANLSLMERWDCVSVHNDTKYGIDPKTDLVVINLGTNDTQAVEQNKTSNRQLTEDIVTVLTAMREKYPVAKFVWCYGNMNEVGATRTAINNALDMLGGEQEGFYYVTMTVDTTGGATHPTVNGHIASARKLVQYIEEKNVVESPRTGMLAEKEINIVSDFGVAGSVAKDFGLYESFNVAKDYNGNSDWGLVPGAEWGAYTTGGTERIIYELKADEGYCLDNIELTFSAVHGHCGLSEYFGNTNLKIYTSTDNANWKCVYDLARIKYSLWNTKTTYNDCRLDCSETTDGRSKVYIKFELVHPDFSGLSAQHQALGNVADSTTQKISLDYLGIRLKKLSISGRQVRTDS